MGEWRRVRIGDVCDIVKGQTGLASATPGEYPLVATGAERRSCNSFQFDTEAVCIPLVSSTGHGKKTLNYVHFQSGKFALGTILAAVIPKDSSVLTARYLHLYLSHFKDTVLVPLMKGAANVTLPLKGIASVEIPAPSIEQQQKLIDLIGRIENEHRELLAECACQADHLKLLRQSILQEAVEGRLTIDWRKLHPVVKGDPQLDAAALLTQIKAEKVRLVKTGKIRKQKPLSAVAASDKPFELPVGWVWSRLGESIVDSDSGWSPKCGSSPAISEEWGVLKTTSVQELSFIEGENKRLPIDFAPKPQYEVRVGDILITRAGPANRVGIACVVNTVRPYLMISDKIIRLHMPTHLSCSKYIATYLNSRVGKATLDSMKTGMAQSQVNITQNNLKKIPIPLPPLTEQLAIVACVDSLMAVIDELERQVTKRAKQTQDLMATVLREAFSGGEARSSFEEEVALPLVAESTAPYSIKEKSVMPIPHAGHNMYNKAALAAYITSKCADDQHPVGKVKIMKLSYLVQRKVEVALTESFVRRAAGPVDDDIHAAINIAGKQQWLRVLPKRGRMIPIVPGADPQPAVEQVRKYFGDTFAAVDQMLEKMKFWGWEALERWATVEPLAREIIEAGTEPTLAAIKAGLAADPVWRAKLKKEAFSDANIASTLRGLREFGFLPEVVTKKQQPNAAPVISRGQAALPAANQPVPVRILARMQLGQSYSRSDLLAATGISTTDWTWAIRQLKEEGKVIQEGEKRGARYRLMR